MFDIQPVPAASDYGIHNQGKQRQADGQADCPDRHTRGLAQRLEPETSAAQAPNWFEARRR